MKKIYLVAVSMLLSLSGLLAQESFEFRNTLADTAREGFNYELVSDHYLGDMIAKKMHWVKETYTYVEGGTPMSPGNKIIVQKPSIYYAIRKINKYYRKEIRKGRINKADAIDQFGSILDKTYAMYDQKTEEFEEYLKSFRKAEELIEAFEKVELI